MKKFLITIFVLLVLGGAGFFFGWAQFSVPPGQYGVISSKTHGIDQRPVRSGEFRWIWYKLIPTNVKITVFNLERINYPVSFDSSLPSGDTYAVFTGLTNADFTWNFRGEINFTLNPDMLVSIAASNNLNDQNDLNAYSQKVAQDIELHIIRVLSSAEEDSVRLEHIMSGNQDAQMEREIRERFPEIKDFSFVIHAAKFPDFVLYRQLRRMYDEFLSSQREYITSGFGRRAENHIEAQLRFENLERYGDLLTRFPVLLEYMTLGLDRNE